ncbi:hypothetical protein [Lactobacillus corticis]|uniref:Uncharacterized protein n=1 Tax=Lactobacillus corticis TaxID=2201249 RepID=A0A916VHW0_9LACO|nr:hypothetical protein [Lactobacillus corticis]GFZ27092.1 hypothetical protein LCB40_09720 [Lactobacillus corticis]
MTNYLVYDIRDTINRKNKVPATTSRLDNFINMMYVIADNTKGGFQGIAIADPGKIDVKNKIIHFGVSLPCFYGLNVKKAFVDQYGVHVDVEKDGKAAFEAIIDGNEQDVKLFNIYCSDVANIYGALQA